MAQAQANIQDDDSLVEYGFRRVIITITAILCALLEIIDTTIVNVALNDMRGSLWGYPYRRCLGNHCLCYCQCNHYPNDKLAF